MVSEELQVLRAQIHRCDNCPAAERERVGVHHCRRTTAAILLGATLQRLAVTVEERSVSNAIQKYASVSGHVELGEVHFRVTSLVWGNCPTQKTEPKKKERPIPNSN